MTELRLILNEKLKRELIRELGSKSTTELCNMRTLLAFKIMAVEDLLILRAREKLQQTDIDRYM